MNKPKINTLHTFTVRKCCIKWVAYQSTVWSKNLRKGKC